MIYAKYIDLLSNIPLFNNITKEEIIDILGCLAVKIKDYKKKEYILERATQVKEVGILLGGSASILRDDYWGKRNIIAKLNKGDMFGEVFACIGSEAMLFDVLVNEDCKVLYINYQKLISTCQHACGFHTQIIKNLLAIIAQKNMLLASKIQHLTQKNSKEKLLSYLSFEARKQQSNSFTIPFNRQELADYLSLERSAMSHTLSQLQKEGFIKFEKNRFILLAGATHKI